MKMLPFFANLGGPFVCYGADRKISTHRVSNGKINRSSSATHAPWKHAIAISCSTLSSWNVSRRRSKP